MKHLRSGKVSGRTGAVIEIFEAGGEVCLN